MKKIFIIVLMIMLCACAVCAESIKIYQMYTDTFSLIVLLDGVMLFVENNETPYKNLVYSYEKETRMLVVSLDNKKIFAVYCPITDMNSLYGVETLGFRSEKYENKN